MPAIAEILSTEASRPDPRGCDLPTCPVCADTMVAAEASAYLHDHVISYLWTCDTCGYGFVTKHSVKRFACSDRFAHALHQVLVIGDVDFRQQHRAQRLP
jgi:hypothetical protein